jgi:hypothetical protein
LADSPSSTITSNSSAPWTSAIVRILAACALRETPRSDSLEIRAEPIAFIDNHFNSLAHHLSIE